MAGRSDSAVSAAVATLSQATGITHAIAGSFTTQSVRELLVVRANVLCLYEWDANASALRATYERKLPARVVCLETLPAATFNTSVGSMKTDLVAMLSSETELSILQWAGSEAEFKPVALHVLSPPQAVTTTETSERSTGLPPLIRVAAAHGVLAVLTHRRFLHLLEPSSAATASPGAAVVAAAVADDAGGWADEDDEEPQAVATTAASAPQAVGDRPTAESQADAPPIVLRSMLDLAGTPALRGVRDFVFLHNRQEPTVAVLRESEPTWAGRVKLISSSAEVRLSGLSCGVSLLALAKSTATEPLTVASLNGLPYDSLSLHPVPNSPATPTLGGVLVAGASSLVHVSPTGTAHGAYLNEHAHELVDAERSAVQWQAVRGGHASISKLVFLEGATIVDAPVASADAPSFARWLLMSHDDGLVYGVVGEHDGNSVHSFTVTRLGSLLPTAGAVTLRAATFADDTPATVFAHSNASDAVVFEVPAAAAKAPATVAKPRPLVSLASVGPVTHFALVDACTRDTEAEAAVKASREGAEAPAQECPYKGVVSEAVLPPVVDAAVASGRESYGLDPLSTLDMALCTGRGDKHGALCVTSRSLRTVAVQMREIECTNTFAEAVPSGADDWATLGVVDAGTAAASTSSVQESSEAAAGEKRRRAGEDDVDLSSASPAHRPMTSYLFMSLGSATVVYRSTGTGMDVLKAGETPVQLDARTTATAVLPAMAARPPVLLQCCTDATLATSSVRVAPLPASSGEPFCWETAATVVDVPAPVAKLYPLGPEAAWALLADGQLLRLVVAADGAEGGVAIEAVNAAIGVGDVTAAALLPPSTREKNHSTDGEGSSTPLVGALLFGSNGEAVRVDVNRSTGAAEAKGTFIDLWQRAAVQHDNGSAPAFRAAVRPKQPFKSTDIDPVIDATAARLSSPTGVQRSVVVDRYALLTVLHASGELVVYRVEPSAGGLRLVRLLIDRHDLAPPTDGTQMSLAERVARRHIADGTGGGESGPVVSWGKRALAGRLVGIANLGGWCGVVVAGRQPKLLVSDRGFPRLHPLRLFGEAPLRSAAPLHIPTCPGGFVACSPARVMLSKLKTNDGQLDLCAPWPRQSVATQGTPSKVVYLASRRAAVVAVAKSRPYRPTKAPFDKELTIPAADTTEDVAATTAPTVEQQAITEKDGIPIPHAPRYSLALYHTVGWMHADSVELLENETIVTMSTVQVVKSTNSIGDADAPLHEAVAVGTAFALGEDHPCRGRLLIFGVTPVNTETESRQLVQVAAENTKGPVTAVTSCRGAIIAAVGATLKVFALDWARRALRTRAFLHSATLVTSLQSVQNYIVVGDLQRSASLLRFNPVRMTLEPIAGDEAVRDALSVGVIANSTGGLGVVSYDRRDNVQVFAVEPRTTSGGLEPAASPLVPTGQLRLSGTVRHSLVLRHPGPAAGSLHGLRPMKHSLASIYVTAEGEIGAVTPVNEKTQRASGWLGTRFAQDVPQPAGIHPKSARAARLSSRLGLQGDALVDGMILDWFLELGIAERKSVAQRASLTPGYARGILVQLMEECSWF